METSLWMEGIPDSERSPRGSSVVYDRTVFVCRPRLIASRAGLFPFQVTGRPLAPCACASRFVMMNGSVIFPQMRHSHPSYSQDWPPSKCLAILNPPHRSQVIGSLIEGSKHVGIRQPSDDPVHRNSFSATPLREALHYHPSHEAPIATVQVNSVRMIRAMTGYIECSFCIGRLVARQAQRDILCESQGTISGHENRSRSIPHRYTILLCRRAQLM
jgi:hypothetical protein